MSSSSHSLAPGGSSTGLAPVLHRRVVVVVALHVLGMGAEADPLVCDVDGGLGTDQSALREIAFRDLNNTFFNNVINTIYTRYI